MNLSTNWQMNIGDVGMSDPNEIIEQCDRLIQKYEEGLVLVKRLRKQAIQVRNENSIWIETVNAWGVPLKVRKDK